jgi:hypothetical protein
MGLALLASGFAMLKRAVRGLVPPTAVSTTPGKTDAVALSAPGGTSGVALVTVQGSDGRSELHVPVGWFKLRLSGDEHGVLKVRDRADEMCVKVISQWKEDFDSAFTYRDYARETLGLLKGNLDNPRVVSGPTHMVIDGRQAVGYEVHGSSRETHIKAAFLHVTVDGRKAFHQVLGVTRPSQVDRNRSCLEGIIHSFREVR